MIAPSFFYHVLKPGRYLGSEPGTIVNGSKDARHTVVWFYPGRYEDAMADAGWRRGYFQLASVHDLRCVRAVDYAQDLWARLSQAGLPPFSLDARSDLRKADVIVFWVPDLFSAARIPAILRRLGLSEERRPKIGVVVDGLWAPRFLLGHVDWLVPAPGAWLPQSIAAVLSGVGELPPSCCDSRDEKGWSRFWESPSDPGPLIPSPGEATSRWIPFVEIGEDFVDVDLGAVDPQGVLRARGTDELVSDALAGLRATGIDGLRFCGTGFSHDAMIAAALTELGRRHNMKRVRAQLPPLSAECFIDHWAGYKPHLVKPVLRLWIDDATDATSLQEIGRVALNAGWHGLSAVLRFDSFAQLSSILPKARSVMEAWQRAADGFADKRTLRLEYEPAPIDRWRDSPAAPSEDEVRSFGGEFRHFKDDLSKFAAVGLFRIEDVMARNWLAASDRDLWPRFTRLELSDPNDENAPAFDWFSWVRQDSGMEGPPRTEFARRPPVALPIPQQPKVPAPSPSSGAISLSAPSEDLFGRRRRRPAFARRLGPPSLTRMRIRWGKGLSWRLYSHLDAVRAIERAVRRAGLPAEYSEGFHPRLKLSFGPPLSFGLISEAEYVDLVLDSDYQPDYAERLSAALPEGLSLVDARGMPAGMPALTDTINEAAFRAVIPLDCERAQAMVQDFHNRPDVRWTRPDRSDRKPIDPRRTLRETTVESTPAGTLWNLNVRIGGEGHIRPTDWAILLFGFTPDQMAEIVIERTALLIRQGATLRTPLEPQ
ncbi:MAG: DUF2344 domain-containing protein [Acidobacteria bacterium]|nr:DUF2344 domain-containing protein [Acidobacteriota bacterium]